jgi:hypothetical protein
MRHADRWLQEFCRARATVGPCFGESLPDWCYKAHRPRRRDGEDDKTPPERSINFLAGIIKRQAIKPIYMTFRGAPQNRSSVTWTSSPSAPSLSSRCYSSQSLCWVGGYADVDQRSFDTAATDERKTSDRADRTAVAWALGNHMGACCSYCRCTRLYVLRLIGARCMQLSIER